MAGSANGMPSPGAAASNNGFTPGNFNIPPNRSTTGMPATALSVPNPNASNPYGSTPPASGVYTAGAAPIGTGIPNLPAAYGGPSNQPLGTPSLPPAAASAPSNYSSGGSFAPQGMMPPQGSLPPQGMLPAQATMPPQATMPQQGMLPPQGMMPPQGMLPPS
jgi:hypothetical protein